MLLSFKAVPESKEISPESQRGNDFCTEDQEHLVVSLNRVGDRKEFWREAREFILRHPQDVTALKTSKEHDGL